LNSGLSILDVIYASRRETLAREIVREPWDLLEERIHHTEPPRFRVALKHAPSVGIIGEVKIASPSRGILVESHRDPIEIALEFEKGGVDAISVVTEEKFFGGSVSLLGKIRAVTQLPILRKDFLTTPYEIAQSAAYGADAVLLIVAGLTDDQLRILLVTGRRYALDVVVEVHDDQELRRALTLKADIIGINNRDLRTFEVSFDTLELLKHVPDDVLAVSESGLTSPADVATAARAGARACLIGEALLRGADPGRFISECRQVPVA